MVTWYCRRLNWSTDGDTVFQVIEFEQSQPNQQQEMSNMQQEMTSLMDKLSIAEGEKLSSQRVSTTTDSA